MGGQVVGLVGHRLIGVRVAADAELTLVQIHG
jgi:hypothetical protein